jgi:hypothetical protein
MKESTRLLAPCQEGDHTFCVYTIVRVVSYDVSPVQVAVTTCACDCHAPEPEPAVDELDMPLLGEFYD